MSTMRDRSSGARGSRDADEYRISELGTCELPREAVTEQDRERLEQLAKRDLLSLTRRSGSGWQIKAGSVVGILVLDRIRLIIEPKLLIDGERLMTWLSYAQDIEPTYPDSARRWQVTSHGLPDLVIAALEGECRKLVRGRLRRDYRQRDRTDTVLRGQLDLRQQATRRFGMLDKLHLHTHEHEVAVWENLVCRVALERAAVVARDPALVQSVQELVAQFPSDPAFDSRSAKEALRRRQYHRMNRWYRPAHTWASFVLNGGGPSDLLVETGLTANSLLLNTYRLWQSVVWRMVAQAVADSAGTVVQPTGSRAINIAESGPPRPFPVDVLVEWSTRGRIRWLPVDAKYKAYQGKSLRNDDAHQLLTYASAYSGDRAAVLYPAHGPSYREAKISGPLGPLARLQLIGIDVNRQPEDCAAALVEHLEPPREPDPGEERLSSG